MRRTGADRRERAPLDPAERITYAQDAHASVTFLSLLMFLWGAISLIAVPMKPFGPWNLLQTVAGGLALLYFVSTRERPSTRLAVGGALVIVGYSFVLLPWTAMEWCKLGRPWEAFTVPQLAMVSVALVVPRYFWLGVGMVALFAAESVFAYVYAHHVGLGAQTPATEPYFSIFFAILSVGVLMLRAERRRLMLSHIRMQAEAEAMKQIGPLLTRFEDQLGVHVATLGRELGHLHEERAATPPLLRMDRAVARLDSLHRTLHELGDGTATTRAGDGSSRPHEPTAAPVASDAERQLLARDAHTATTVFVAMLAAMTPIILIKHDVLVGAALFPFAIGLAVLIFAMLLYVLATRRRPSERRARNVVLVIFFALLPILTLNQISLLAMNRPHAPFMGHKFLMVSMALVAGSRLGLGIALDLVTWASALAAFYLLDLGAHRDVISLAEPWVTTVFMAIGIVVLVMRERRRLASISLLRAEAHAAAEYRRVGLILALRDQLNSPLQSLLASAVVLDLEAARAKDTAGVHAAVEGLVTLSHDLAHLEDVIPKGAIGVSFDAARELTRRS